MIQTDLYGNYLPESKNEGKSKHQRRVESFIHRDDGYGITVSWNVHNKLDQIRRKESYSRAIEKLLWRYEQCTCKNDRK